MDRRALLKTGSAALLGFGLAGCGASRGARAATARPTAAPRAATCVLGSDHPDHGRPAAAPRRRVRAARRQARRQDPHPQLRPWRRRHVAGVGLRGAGRRPRAGRWTRRAAVIGCGSPGLSAARQLQRRGFDVTIYAATVPPDTTSNMSLAGFTPTTALIEPERRTPAWDAQFRDGRRDLVPPAAADGRPALRRLLDRQLQRHRRSGAPAARAATTTCCPSTPHRAATARCWAPASIRFPTRYAVRAVAWPSSRRSTWTRWSRTSSSFGGRIVIRKFDRRAILPRSRAGDRQLHRPRLVHALRRQGAGAGQGPAHVSCPQPEVNYRASCRLPDGTNAASTRAATASSSATRRSRASGRWSWTKTSAAERRRRDRVFLGDAAAPSRRR